MFVLIIKNLYIRNEIFILCIIKNNYIIIQALFQNTNFGTMAFLGVIYWFSDLCNETKYTIGRGGGLMSSTGCPDTILVAEESGGLLVYT